MGGGLLLYVLVLCAVWFGLDFVIFFSLADISRRKRDMNALIIIFLVLSCLL